MAGHRLQGIAKHARVDGGGVRESSRRFLENLECIAARNDREEDKRCDLTHSTACCARHFCGVDRNLHKVSRFRVAERGRDVRITVT
jgi:hypothetical protein